MPGPNLTENALKIFQLRYSLKDEQGLPTETPDQAIKRVATNVAKVRGKGYGADWKSQARRYEKELLTPLKFVPNSPTWTGAGTGLGQLAACFPAGTAVHTAEGLKAIEEIVVGDRVLTHEGRYRPVTETMIRSNEEGLVKVSVTGRPDFSCTPEHPVLVGDRGWVRAQDLQPGDQLISPSVAKTAYDQVSFDLADGLPDDLEVQVTENTIRASRISAYQNSGRKGAWNHRFLEGNEQLALLMGYYAAEGSLEGGKAVRFTFGLHERMYVDEVVALSESILGVTPNVQVSNFGRWITVNLYSRPFALWVEREFGRGSDGKRIPEWLQEAVLETQRSFLIGLFRGDGLCKNYGQKLIRLTLANPSLIAQVASLVDRQGWGYSWRFVDTTYTGSVVKPTAQISIVPSSVPQSFVDETWGDKGFRVPRSGWHRNGQVRNITVLDEHGPVYNFEVEEDHSYVVYGTAVHNCFVLPISDDLGRTRSSIFETLKVAALIQQTGGGNGFDFSELRPKGALIKKSMGQSSGPVSFLKVYDASFGSIQQGGCLAPDTLVSTGDGLYRLDELVTHDGWQDASGSVWTDEGFRTLLGTYNNGVRDTLSVTSSLPTLRGTPNHRVKILTDDGPRWKRLDELVPGDSMITALGGHSGHLQTLAIPPIHHSNQNVPTQWPTILTPELAWFLGYLAGDGFVASGIQDYRVGLSVAHSSYLMDELPEMMTGLFPGIHVSTQQKPNDASKVFVWNNRAIKDFMILNGLDKTTSCEAKVPLKVRQSPPEIVGAYLAGLFEADGFLSHGYPQLSSTSDRLIDEVATLCLGLGIPVKIRNQSFGYGHLGTSSVKTVTVVSHEGLLAWRKVIPTHSGSRFQGQGLDINEASTNPELRRALLSSYRRLSKKYPEFAAHVRPLGDYYYVPVMSVEEDAEPSLTLDLEVADNHTYTAFGLVTHNTRRGANMSILRCDHPDVVEFVQAKLVEGEIANFNISVALTDEFMELVVAGRLDDEFELVHKGRAYATIRVGELWDLLTRGAWTLGDPGAFFVDRANEYNPCPGRYTLAATNPCGEQALPPYSNCCLGSIAVNRFVRDGRFDWDDFSRTIELSVQFLDDVVDANKYLEEVPELEEAAMGERRIGLGIMGLADCLFAMGLGYDTDEGLAFVDQLMEHFRFHTMLASCMRAKERGPFGWFEDSVYSNDDWKVGSTTSVGIGHNFGRPTLDWELIRDLVKEHGIRNACQTTVAPTGTISNVAGLEGSGIEPAFALSYVRKVMQEGENIELHYLSPAFESALRKGGYTDEEVEDILMMVEANGGSCQGLDGFVGPDLQRVFKVAGDIAPLDHVRMQATCQKWIDNAISKTINMPNDATVEDVQNVYVQAWIWGCKGITVYRQGSRELEVLSTKKSDDLKLELTMGQVIEEESWPVLRPMQMPDYVKGSYQGVPKGLPARVFEVTTPFGNMQVTITELRSHPGRPFDIRLQIGKAGNDKHADVEAIGRMASVSLRLGGDVRALVDQLVGIGGKTQAGFGPNRIKSVADGLGKLLHDLYLEGSDGLSEAPENPPEAVLTAANGPDDGWAPYGTCPACKNATLIFKNGCAYCEVSLGGCGSYSGCD